MADQKSIIGAAWMFVAVLCAGYPGVAGAGEEKDLLILYPESFESVVDIYRDYKEESGIRTMMASWQQIDRAYPALGRDSPERIKRYIDTCKRLNGIRHVLLVGDSDVFPVRYVYSDVQLNEQDGGFYPADLYYADLYCRDGRFSDWDGNTNGLFGEMREGTTWDEVNADGMDYYPDVAVGRIPASNANEFMWYANKVLIYETCGNSGNWRYRAALMTSEEPDDSVDDDVSGWGDVWMGGYSLTRLFENCNLPNTHEPTVERIQQTLRQGVGLITFMGHGSPTTWNFVGYAYSRSNVLEIQNSNRYPIAFAAACSTAKFAPCSRDSYLTAAGQRHAGGDFAGRPPEPAPVQRGYDKEGMAETFLVKGEHGAVAYMGSTSVAQGDHSNLLIKHFLKHLGTNRRTGGYALGDAWVGMATDYFTEECKPGGAGNHERWLLRRMAQVRMYPLFGDPSMRIHGVSGVFNLAGYRDRLYAQKLFFHCKVSGENRVNPGDSFQVDGEVIIHSNRSDSIAFRLRFDEHSLIRQTGESLPMRFPNGVQADNGHTLHGQLTLDRHCEDEFLLGCTLQMSVNGSDWIDGPRDYVAINERGALLGVASENISTPTCVVRYTSLLTQTRVWNIQRRDMDGLGEVPFYHPRLNMVLFPLVKDLLQSNAYMMGLSLCTNNYNPSGQYFRSSEIPMTSIEGMRRFWFLDPLKYEMWIFQDSPALSLRNIVNISLRTANDQSAYSGNWNNSLGVPLAVDASKASPGLWTLGSQSFGYVDRSEYAFRDYFAFRELCAVSGSNASIAATADGGCWICEPRGLRKVNAGASWTEYLRTFSSTNHHRLLGCTPHDEPWLLDTSNLFHDRVRILDGVTTNELDFQRGLPKFCKWIVSSVDEAIFASQPNYETEKTMIWKVSVDGGVQYVQVDSAVSFFAYQALSNRPPVFRSVAAKTVGPGSKVTFRVSATDPDGDALTYRAVSLPAGATFDPATRIFTWKVPAWADVVKAWQASFKPISTRVPLAAAFNVRFEVVDREGNVGRLTASVDVTQFKPAEIMQIEQNIVAVDSCPLPSPDPVWIDVGNWVGGTGN